MHVKHILMMCDLWLLKSEWNEWNPSSKKVSNPKLIGVSMSCLKEAHPSMDISTINPTVEITLLKKHLTGWGTDIFHSRLFLISFLVLCTTLLLANSPLSGFSNRWNPIPHFHELNAILRWAMGLSNWLVTGDITLYIPIIIHVL